MIRNMKVLLIALCLVSFTLSLNEKKLKTKTQQRNPYPYISSVNTGRSISINFYNSQNYSVRIYWVDFRGNLVFYRSLSSGHSYHVNSNFRHAWVWISYSGFPHGYYIATSSRHQTYRI